MLQQSVASQRVALLRVAAKSWFGQKNYSMIGSPLDGEHLARRAPRITATEQRAIEMRQVIWAGALLGVMAVGAVLYEIAVPHSAHSQQAAGQPRTTSGRSGTHHHRCHQADAGRVQHDRQCADHRLCVGQIARRRGDRSGPRQGRPVREGRRRALPARFARRPGGAASGGSDAWRAIRCSSPMLSATRTATNR